MTLELDPLLLTGIDEIDAQHRELFARVGALLVAARTQRSREEVVRLLEFLGTYVVEHFASEERTMEAAGYPKYGGHRAEHLQFVKELSILRHELETEGPSHLFVIRVGNRVTEWLREHIYRTDRILADWLKSHPGA
jgi:hemerythrin